MTTLARSAVLDADKGHVYIDGVLLPWWVGENPTVDPGGRDYPIATLTIDVLIDGPVTIKRDGGTAVIDSVLGDVGEFARNLVRTGLAERLPWLQIDTPAAQG